MWEITDFDFPDDYDVEEWMISQVMDETGL